MKYSSQSRKEIIDLSNSLGEYSIAKQKIEISQYKMIGNELYYCTYLDRTKVQKHLVDVRRLAVSRRTNISVVKFQTE